MREEASSPQTPGNRPEARWGPALFRAEKEPEKKGLRRFCESRKGSDLGSKKVSMGAVDTVDSPWGWLLASDGNLLFVGLAREDTRARIPQTLSTARA